MMFNSLGKLFRLRSSGEKIVIIVSIFFGLAMFAYAVFMRDADYANWIMSLFYLVAILPSLFIPSFLAFSSNDTQTLILLKTVGVACWYALEGLLFGYGIIWLRRQILRSKLK